MTPSSPKRFLTFSPEKRSKLGPCKHLEALWYDSALIKPPSALSDAEVSIAVFFVPLFFLFSFLISSLISVYAKWSDAQRPCSGSNCPLVSDAVRGLSTMPRRNTTTAKEGDLRDFLPAWRRKQSSSVWAEARGGCVCVEPLKKVLLKLKWTTFTPPAQQVSRSLLPRCSVPLVDRLTQRTTSELKYQK